MNKSRQSIYQFTFIKHANIFFLMIRYPKENDFCLKKSFSSTYTLVFIWNKIFSFHKISWTEREKKRDTCFLYSPHSHMALHIIKVSISATYIFIGISQIKCVVRPNLVVMIINFDWAESRLEPPIFLLWALPTELREKRVKTLE